MSIFHLSAITLEIVNTMHYIAVEKKNQFSYQFPLSYTQQHKKEEILEEFSHDSPSKKHSPNHSRDKIAAIEQIIYMGSKNSYLLWPLRTFISSDRTLTLPKCFLQFSFFCNLKKPFCSVDMQKISKIRKGRQIGDSRTVSRMHGFKKLTILLSKIH